MKVLVTRSRAQSRPLVDALVERAFDVVVLPLIRIESLGDEPIDTDGYDWIIVTSANGARELARRAHGPLPPIAAVGPATAAALEEVGLRVSLTADVPSQEGLVEAFATRPRRPLFVGAEGARSLLAEQLGADFLPLYRTVELAVDDLPAVDLVLLMSPSAARAYARAGGRAPVVSIGLQTSQAARAAGLDVVAEAKSPDARGLVDSAAAWRDSSPS